MNPKHTDIAHLVYLAGKSQQHESLKQWLFRPNLLFRDLRGPKAFSAAFEQVRICLRENPDLQKMVELHLLTGFLLFGEHMPEWTPSWLRDHMDTVFYLPFTEPEQGRWRAVPVFLTGDQDSFLRCFVTGFVPEIQTPLWPEWAGPLMSEETRRAVSDAAAAVSRLSCRNAGSLFCYPLTLPNACVQFRGRSLGLSLGLGFLAALHGNAFPAEIGLTGDLREDGRVEKVASVQKKTGLAIARGFRVFLHPSANLVPKQPKDILLLPVKNLNQARMLMQLYSPGESEGLGLFSDMLENPLQFIRNIQSVPSQWIEWAWRHDYARPVMEQICSSPSLFSALTDRFENTVRSSHTGSAEVISGLISWGPELEKIRQIAPLSAFRWAALNLCMCNHRGRPSRAEEWGRIAQGLLGEALRADIRAVTDYFNYVFILRHNRYDFRTELPQGLQTVLDLLEKQYAPQCAFGCPVHMSLGAIYGSMTQNYAFCGPDFLRETLSFSAKARKALGEHTVPEYREEWLRQYNYLTYAYLDAGNADSARETLSVYLESPDLIGGFSGFSQWQHALTARFLADTQAPESESYYGLCRENPAISAATAHPWQIWCLNMGRIAWFLNEKADSIRWFRRSLEYCLSDCFGSTVRVMSLLPLSHLQATGNLPEHLPEITCQIHKAAQKVNSRHFRILSEQKLEKVLESVRNSPARWFPFTYR